MTRHKPFSRTELKILVYNKMRQRGMSYDEAIKEVEMEIDKCKENSKTDKKKNGHKKSSC